MTPDSERHSAQMNEKKFLYAENHAFLENRNHKLTHKSEVIDNLSSWIENKSHLGYVLSVVALLLSIFLALFISAIVATGIFILLEVWINARTGFNIDLLTGTFFGLFAIVSGTVFSSKILYDLFLASVFFYNYAVKKDVYAFLLKRGDITEANILKYNEDRLARYITYSYLDNTVVRNGKFVTQSDTNLSVGDDVYIVHFGEVSFVL